MFSREFSGSFEPTLLKQERLIISKIRENSYL